MWKWIVDWEYHQLMLNVCQAHTVVSENGLLMSSGFVVGRRRRWTKQTAFVDRWMHIEECFRSRVMLVGVNKWNSLENTLFYEMIKWLIRNTTNWWINWLLFTLEVRRDFQMHLNWIGQFWKIKILDIINENNFVFNKGGPFIGLWRLKFGVSRIGIHIEEGFSSVCHVGWSPQAT